MSTDIASPSAATQSAAKEEQPKGSNQPKDAPEDIVVTLAVICFFIGLISTLTMIIIDLETGTSILAGFLKTSWKHHWQLFSHKPEHFWRLVSWPFEVVFAVSWTVFAILLFPAVMFLMGVLFGAVGAGWGWGLKFLWKYLKVLNGNTSTRTHQD